MKIIWKYQKSKKGIRILKAYGDVTNIRVPGEIEGIPVTEIGPYAFSASEMPAHLRVKDEEICSFVQEDGLFSLIPDDKLPEFSGLKVSEVRLPDSVTEIGNYAFYGCKNFKLLGFSSALTRTGSGLFVGCAAIRYLEYHILAPGSRSLFQMMSDIRYNLTVSITDDTVTPTAFSKLIFPEYFEHSVENHAARLFDMHITGMGYRYRQSFINDGTVINYKYYDEQLELAITLATKEEVAELALNRLTYPNQLTPEAKKAYLEFFSRYAWEAGEWLIARDDPESIRMLANAGAFDGSTDTVTDLFVLASKAEKASDAEGTGDFYTQAMGESGFGGYVEKALEEEELAKRKSANALEVMLELAGKKGKTECVSILMDYRHKKQGGAPKKRKTFDL